MRHLVNLCEQAAGLRDIHTNSTLLVSPTVKNLLFLSLRTEFICKVPHRLPPWQVECTSSKITADPDTASCSVLHGLVLKPV